MKRCTDLPQPLLGTTLDSRAGKYSTELAKMMGMTPAWLNFNGIYVLCPPYMRLPTTRLANCTGIRRWPFSVKTMATNNNSDSPMMMANLTLPPWARTAAPPAGMPATTLVKIRIDIPCPMPRWVMVSPSHMTSTVPAVSVITMRITRGTVNLGMRSMSESPVLLPRKPPPPLWNTNARPIDCMSASARVR